jgi:hypothetical protein
VIDDELETELRGIFARAGAGITVPEQARERLLGRSYRPRTASRRLAAGITAAAAAAGAAAAVTMLAPASRPPAVQLTAWTVVTQANGNVVVTIRELRDPGGLQRELRADGIPASVIFGDHQNPSCRPYPAGEDLTEKVFPTPQGPPPSAIQVTIHPSALPGGAGVQLFDGAIGQPGPGRTFSIGVGLVHTSPRCTGS